MNITQFQKCSFSVSIAGVYLQMRIFLTIICIVGTSAWKRGLKRIASASLGLCLLTGASMPSFSADAPRAGATAPAFSLPSNFGRNIGLEELKGSWSVVYFYPGDFTAGCTLEAKLFQSDYKKYSDMGVLILGISVDSIDKHLDFQKKYGLEFPLASDEGGKVSDQFGALLNIPFIGKFSNRQTYIIGPDSTVRAVFRDVENNISKHSSDVLAKLTELMGDYRPKTVMM